jgi:hypothetical protein
VFDLQWRNGATDKRNLSRPLTRTRAGLTMTLQKISILETNSSQLQLRHTFAAEQERLAAELKAARPIIHHGDRGAVAENVFLIFLRKYLPYRYAVTKGSVIDSTGAVCDSIDIIIYDRQYTPPLLDLQDHRYIPAEAVYAVFECKPTINKEYLEYAADKAASVRRLKRTSVPIVHAGGTFAARQPFTIVSGILAARVDWAEGLGKSFLSALNNLVGESRLDCGYAASGQCFDTFTPGTKVVDSDCAAAVFIFRLLNQLQSLGTVTAVDWSAYGDAVGGERV